MSEIKIFCSVIIFTLGIYTLFLLQHESHTLNSVKSGNSVSHCNVTARTKLELARLNCGSASDIESLKLATCSELPCDILPNVTYDVELAFIPSRELTTLEIHAFVSQRSDLKYLLKETVQLHSNDMDVTSLKFSFTFPPYPFFKFRSNKKSRKCILLQTYLLGIEVWDVPSGIGEICLVIPINVHWTNMLYNGSNSN